MFVSLSKDLSSAAEFSPEPCSCRQMLNIFFFIFLFYFLYFEFSSPLGLLVCCTICICSKLLVGVRGVGFFLVFFVCFFLCVCVLGQTESTLR